MPFSFATWDDAIRYLFTDLPKAAAGRAMLAVIDEFPCLTKAVPGLAALLQREIDRYQTVANRLRLLLCGSALSVMDGLLTSGAPLRGRAALELVVRPFGYRDAAAFWGVAADPRLAVRLHAVLGGTPAYRRQFLADDGPASLEDFPDWLCRTVLSPVSPLFREARHLLAEETEIRDPALYHSVLAAVAGGNATRGGIAGYIGRKAVDISHPLTVLEDAHLLVRDNDLFRAGRSRYRIAEPLITFYEAIMRPSWSRLEAGQAEAVWRESAQRFASQVAGPHFEQLCREHVLATGPAGEVGGGVVTDPKAREQIEIDVAVVGTNDAGPRKVLALGEAKWGKEIGQRHVDRLTRARDLLAAHGYDTEDCALLCFSCAGSAPGLREDVTVLGPADLYPG